MPFFTDEGRTLGRTVRLDVQLIVLLYGTGQIFRTESEPPTCQNGRPYVEASAYARTCIGPRLDSQTGQTVRPLIPPPFVALYVNSKGFTYQFVRTIWQETESLTFHEGSKMLTGRRGE